MKSNCTTGFGFCFDSSAFFSCTDAAQADVPRPLRHRLQCNRATECAAPILGTVTCWLPLFFFVLCTASALSPRASSSSLPVTSLALCVLFCWLDHLLIFHFSTLQRVLSSLKGQASQPLSRNQIINADAELAELQTEVTALKVRLYCSVIPVQCLEQSERLALAACFVPRHPKSGQADQ